MGIAGMLAAVLWLHWDALPRLGEGCSVPAPGCCWGGRTGLLTVTGICCCAGNEKCRKKNRQVETWDEIMESLCSTRVFLMLFLPRWWRKLIAWLMQKAWWGIDAFLAKIMLCYDYKMTLFSASLAESQKVGRRTWHGLNCSGYFWPWGHWNGKGSFVCGLQGCLHCMLCMLYIEIKVFSQLCFW